ncbi:DNA-directed RNA polymerase I subunit 2 [Selaginella moellendorffii]|uniref:DNA-directed RNA polymerase I subunit 2 n=1 Tax=Selaginella moellendorffii TaxID=88036 RepID=UPI000D1CEE84|nr:DNA-directed RNA polymerase I subunit 2 [Selaginella moellendorffii]|eukprot:XP_024524228.1 DNA-directed RNA polymerase I subunit 2 [Selaginella moellendorffii]
MEMRRCALLTLLQIDRAKRKKRKKEKDGATTSRPPRIPDSAAYKALEDLVSPHIDSFDYFVQRGLVEAVKGIAPVEIEQGSTGNKLILTLDKPVVQPPVKDLKEKAMEHRLLPKECRQGFLSYTGALNIQLILDYGSMTRYHQLSLGKLPIMLKSSLCHLRGLSPQKLISLKEEGTEMGGYFIVKGIERIIRKLIVPKRNHIIAIRRNAFQNRGAGFSDIGLMMRCVRPDQTGSTIKLYYLHHGTARLGFVIRRQEFVIPVGIILKAFMDTSDREIFEQLSGIHVQGQEQSKGAVGSQLISQRARIIIEETQRQPCLTRLDCLRYIGETFRTPLEALSSMSNAEVGEDVLRRFVFVHLDNFRDKFNLLIHMLHKLFAVVDGSASIDSSDTLQHQELLLPGHLMNIYLKDRLEDWLYRCKRLLQREMQLKEEFDLSDHAKVLKIVEKNNAVDIGKRIEYLLSTGNIQSQSHMDLQQANGFSVVAEKLNFFRFISHFRSVHRGAFFARQRTTSVRKLLPESWGFLCPVHTPDGEPCGLLTHLSSLCKISTDLDQNNHPKDPKVIHRTIATVLAQLGMVSISPLLALSVPQTVSHLRSLKVTKGSQVPIDLEIGYVPCTYAGAYPGLFLYTTPSRFLRPVKQLDTGAIELISAFEQAYMEIACPDGGNCGRTPSAPPATHIELHPTAMLSVVASSTPWSDHNQSPRNMYQCQMGKQTLGFASQALKFRTDHKMYNLQNPQSPVARNVNYKKYNMDEFPLGTNAVVAVLAYTGFDMEDAMIMNKSSMERGLAHGQIYKTEHVDLSLLQKKSDGIVNLFSRPTGKRNIHNFLDVDGLPHIGQTMHNGDPYCSVLNTMTGDAKLHKLKAAENVVIDSVIAIGHGRDPLQKIAVKFRHDRNPVIGDKFSSRHGQKGILSQLWPDIDMPFSAVTGMRPDIIINPHAFPSRMTIGMLMESMAAKAGVLRGEYVDSTPFRSSSAALDAKDGKTGSGYKGKDKHYPAISEFGEQLAQHGFNYHGTEVMYSGLLGTELTCEIFIGVVYYQRLRHMVSDKFQVRSLGAINPVTRQPVGGRKLGGGIRFGEMERDSLLAHGAAYLLHDRLHTSSDYHVGDVCTTCGSLLSTLMVPSKQPAVGARNKPKKATCKVCQSNAGVVKVAMPFVFRYLAAELAAMNVKLTLKVASA